MSTSPTNSASCFSPVNVCLSNAMQVDSPSPGLGEGIPSNQSGLSNKPLACMSATLSENESAQERQAQKRVRQAERQAQNEKYCQELEELDKKGLNILKENIMFFKKAEEIKKPIYAMLQNFRDEASKMGNATLLNRLASLMSELIKNNGQLPDNRYVSVEEFRRIVFASQPEQKADYFILFKNLEILAEEAEKRKREYEQFFSTFSCEQNR